MNFHQDDAKTHAQIAEIEESASMSPQEKKNKISVLKESKLQGTDSSLKTITSLANTMIGSSVIIYPVLFVKDGMIGSTIIMLVVGCIQFITCRLLVIHNRPDEPSFNQSILRIGGRRVSQFNSLVNALLLFIVCIVYYLLVATNFYQVSSALVKEIDHSYIPPEITQIKFGTYSMQWACIICAVAAAPVLFMKKIDPVLKMIRFSIYCVLFYGLFIVANLIRQIARDTIQFNKFKHFDSDFSSVAGAFALSFLIHPTASPILKKNVDYKNNERDLCFGYILTAFIYFFVGFIGGLTCAPQVQDIYKNPANYSTIFDCVRSEETSSDRAFYIVGKIVQSGILFQNFSVLPVLFFLARKQFISLVNKPHLNARIFRAFTAVFIVIAALFGILAVDVSIILSLDGAIVGFFMGYGIPIFIHLKCLFHKYTAQENEKRRSLLESIQESETRGMELDEETENQLLKCNPHQKQNKALAYIFYGFILLLGVALGVFKISAFIK